MAWVPPMPPSYSSREQPQHLRSVWSNTWAHKLHKSWEPRQHQQNEKKLEDFPTEIPAVYLLQSHFCDMAHTLCARNEVGKARQDLPLNNFLLSLIRFPTLSPPQANRESYSTAAVPGNIFHLPESFCASALQESFALQQRCQQHVRAGWFQGTS